MSLSKRQRRDKRLDFIMEYGVALHQSGAPAHRLEGAVDNLAGEMGIESNIFSTPTSLMAEFRVDGRTITRLARIEPGDAQLFKIEKLEQLLDDVRSGSIELEDALHELRNIVSMPSPYPLSAELLGFMLVSASAAMFFSTYWMDVALSGVIGLLVGCTLIYSKYVSGLGQIVELAAAFVAAIIAYGFYIIFPYYQPENVILASIIVLLPGLSLTTGMAELASRNLVSGTARLMGSLIVLFKLIFGIALGRVLIVKLPGFQVMEPFGPQFETWHMWLMLATTPLAFTVLFRASWQDAKYMLPIPYLAILSTQQGGEWLGPELGSYLGGLVVGLYGNLFARITQKPASVLIIPGIILLVPGSLGFRGFSMLLEKNTIVGVETAFGMFLVAVALVVGLFTANMLILPKRHL